ncbi:MAG: hypothetical protein PHG85_03125 [Candidatus Altiarchaeota archaeon]|nr:hypothetical protein [Candidatus Altiarchaeota archaeon]
MSLYAVAGIADCAPGYRFDRLSGVGCVQDKCSDVSHAFYNYVGYCVCYACGEVGCSGDKAFSKECRRPRDYESCPGCLYACVSPESKCPGEQDAKPPSSSATPTTVARAGAQTTLAVKTANDTVRVKVKGKLTAFGRPLKYVRLSCGDKEVMTDGDGNYEFETGDLKKGEEFGCEIKLEYVRDGKTYFMIHHQDNPDSTVYYHSFKVENDVEQQDLKLDELFKESDPGSEAYVSAYVHMTEALEFYLDGLNEKLDFQLPLHVKLFMPNDPEKPKAAYNGDDGSVIEFQERSSLQDAPGRQIMFYHEFSHYVMQTLYGKWPHSEGVGGVEESNHGGLINPGSSDSYVEGFAVFMSKAMAEEYGDTIPSGKDYSKMSFRDLLIEAGNSPITDIETDYTAWDRQGRMEEYAIAGVLWDLVDNEETYKKLTPEQMYANYLQWKKETQEFNEYTKREYPGEETIVIPEYDIDYFKTVKLDDDNVDLDAGEVWKVLREYRGDFTEVHNALKDRFSGDKEKIDEVFAKHGFFADNRPGNGQHDDFEPYLDKNKNGQFDEGEYYVDYSSEEPKYEAGMAIGSAKNYQQGWRKTTQEVLGQFVAVDNDAPYYAVAVIFPERLHLNYAFRTENQDGRIYLDMPPAGYGAVVIVQAEGVEAQMPLAISSDKFNQEYAQAVEKGYYIGHDFRITGPIPGKPPVPKGTLPQKGGASWMWAAAGVLIILFFLAAGAMAVVMIVFLALILKRLARKFKKS